MSNVKTGDLAWWKITDGPWPVCTIGKQSYHGESFNTDGGAYLNGTKGISWMCDFGRPIRMGYIMLTGRIIHAQVFPISDAKLKKISDGRVALLTTVKDLEIFTDGPISPDEREAVERIKKERSIVKPRG